MIYTVTLNPSIDYFVSVKSMELAHVNRYQDSRYFPGGKGINVSILLASLKMKSVAFGFTAGFTGREIEHSIAKKGIQTDFINLQNGSSRINIKAKSESGFLTELDGDGPDVHPKALLELLQKVENRVQSGDFLVLSGSVPKSIPDEIYHLIADKVAGSKVKIIVDAVGNPLKMTLQNRPFLVKPNQHELGQLFQKTIKSYKEICFYAKKLQEAGARNVVVSMAEQGAVFLQEDGTCLYGPAVTGKMVSSVGAGDSMVAGFLYGIATTGNSAEAFKWGLAAGAATAFSEGIANREKVLENHVKLQPLREMTVDTN